MAKKKQPGGKVIKLSRDLTSHLDELRESKESYDSLLRRHFGLTSRSGHPQELRTYYIIDTAKDLIARRDLKEARGDVILLAVKRGQKLTDKQKKDAIITARELP